MDTFLAAAMIPTILFGVFNGALVSALVPTFSEYLAHDRKEDEAWRLGSTIAQHARDRVLALCRRSATLPRRWYVPLIAHGFPTPQMGVAIRMTRWLMPSIVAVSLARRAFRRCSTRITASAPPRSSASRSTSSRSRCVVLLNRKLGIYALGLGNGIGPDRADARAASRIRRDRRATGSIIDLHHPGLKKMWALLGPIIVGLRGGAARAVLRSLLCVDARARLHRRDELRDASS